MDKADNPRQSLETTYALIPEFTRRFKELHVSVICKELINLDLSKSEELAEARNKKVFTTTCPDFVGDAVKIVGDLLQLPS